jgi:hypothetical protein
MHRKTRLPVAIAVLVLLVSSIAAASTASAEPDDPATGFAGTQQMPPETIDVHIDASAPAQGADGTEAHPYPTLHWGMYIANWARGLGHPIRVVIAPGTYREPMSVIDAGEDPPPLVIEAEVPGTVVVSGADVETRWTPVTDRPGAFTAPWTTNWGLSKLPDWGGYEANVSEGARRRENVLIDGVPLRQVLSADALTPGTFSVDEAGDQLLMAPPAGTDLQASTVEVATRTSVLTISQTRDVILRGLTFETGAAGFEHHMAYITDSADVLVEDTTFRHSSWHGLGFSRVARITVRDSHFVDNGGNGLNTNSTTDAVIEGNEISRNNVRGWANGWSGWSVAGSKNLRLTNAVFRGNTYVDNQARALWLDTDIQNVLVDREQASGNYKDGILIEAAQGPVTVRDSSYVWNWAAGISFGPASDVTVERTTMANNGLSQILFEHDRERTFPDRVTGEQVTLRDFSGLTFRDNTVVSDGSHPMGATPLVATRWIPIQDWRPLLSAGEITAEGTTWEHVPEVIGFWITGDTSYTLDEWAADTGDGDTATTTTTTSTTTSTTTTVQPTTTTTTAPSVTKGKGSKDGGSTPSIVEVSPTKGGKGRP